MGAEAEGTGGKAGWFAAHRYAILLSALTLLLVTAPALETITEGGWRPAVVAAKAVKWALLFFACILAVGRSHTLVALAMAALTGLALEGLDTLGLGQTIPSAGRAIFACAMITWAVVHLLRRTFSAQVVRTSNLHAAAAIYLLLGFAFANAYQILHVLQPGAFHFPEGTGAGENVFFYFSFITLATVGYGDVVPVSGTARMLAVTEALAGQVYLVVSLSRLVGLYVAHRTSRGGD
jgi:hypothetical protein